MGTQSDLWTFERIQESVNSEGHMEGSRTPEVDMSYRRHKVITNAKYASVEDMLREKLFCSKTKQKSDGRLKAIKGTEKEKFCFIANKFPYKMEEGLNHWVFWSKQAITLTSAKQKVQKAMNGREFVMWRNPRNLRSVPGIWHAQVVYKGEKLAL